MGSDDLHKKRQKKRRKDKIETRKVIPYRYLIVCEGEKTEPNYFKYFQKIINEKFSKEIVKGVTYFHIEGKGMNTESLIEEAKRINEEASIQYGNIWCIFDKDDFTARQFNSAIETAKQENIKTAWSNESIELWFLLHFENITTGITRNQYIEKLNIIFKEKNIRKGIYEKNLNNMYEILRNYGNQELAIFYAKQLEAKYNEWETPSKMKPATRVYELVEELEKIIKE